MSRAVPIPQRATLVLPTTGEFDSRAYRIAAGLADRGHAVTILARGGPGLPADEFHEAGYRILRVPVSAVAGLPLPGPLISTIERRLARRRSAASRAPDASGSPDGQAPGGSGRLRRAVAGVVRLARIWLTVRSQSRASRRVDAGGDIYHGMAYMGVPVALDLGRRNRARVVYDARDIYLEARNLARLPWPARRLFAAVERRWARRADRVVTVNEAYAEVMAERFGLVPLVVMNCSRRDAIPAARPWLIHEALALPHEERIVLYHGGLAPERGIEQLIDALPALGERTHVALMGYGPLADEIDRQALRPDLGGRLHRLPAVAPTELIGWVASADVVAMPIQPTTLNHRLTTPNKLFEAMTAGTPVVASDLPGMAPIVAETGCGVVCDPTDVASIREAIRTLLDLDAEAYAAVRARATAAASERYSWEGQLDVLLDEYGRLTGRPW